MTNLKDKIKNTLNWIKENPKKSILGIGLTALVATTALKDNVHFGSVQLDNPQKNQYAWGLFPTTTLAGENAKGNIYTFGLVVGENHIGENSKITGNMNAYGLMAGANNLNENSQITGNMNAYGLLIGRNVLGNNSQITGDISNKGIFVKNTIAGFTLGSNDVKGLENYIMKGKEK
ncbi:MAG: hypothetical protein AABY06_02755 [Nanoarchaeota archaeon]